MAKTIVFEPPGVDAPGYLRRAKKSLEFRQKAFAKDSGPEVIDELVEFLLPYVKEPADRSEARETLLDASEAQFMQLIDAVSGESKDPTSAQPKNEPSNAGPAE